MGVHKLHCNVHLRFIAIEVWSFFKTKITVYVPLVSELLFYTVSFEVEYADMNSLSWISIFLLSFFLQINSMQVKINFADFLVFEDKVTKCHILELSANSCYKSF